MKVKCHTMQIAGFQYRISHTLKVINATLAGSWPREPSLPSKRNSSLGMKIGNAEKQEANVTKAVDGNIS